MKTSDYGKRVDPVTGGNRLHTGVDFSAPDGTPILAAADGTVTFAGTQGGYGGLIVVDHTVDGQPVATAYAHLWDNGFHVAVGDRVTAGQHIGDVGSAGNSTGPHLHFEVRPGGADASAIDPVPWLDQYGAADLGAAEGGTSTQPASCQPSVTAGQSAPTPSTASSPVEASSRPVDERQ